MLLISSTINLTDLIFSVYEFNRLTISTYTKKANATLDGQYAQSSSCFYKNNGYHTCGYNWRAFTSSSEGVPTNKHKRYNWNLNTWTYLSKYRSTLALPNGLSTMAVYGWIANNGVGERIYACGGYLSKNKVTSSWDDVSDSWNQNHPDMSVTDWNSSGISARASITEGIAVGGRQYNLMSLKFNAIANTWSAMTTYSYENTSQQCNYDKN